MGKLLEGTCIFFDCEFHYHCIYFSQFYEKLEKIEG